MTRAKRTDGNQAEIVAGLRDAGLWVVPTHGVGCGYPDLCVILPGRIVLLEVKRKGEGLRGEYEQEFHRRAGELGAPVYIVRSVEEALAAVERMK